MRDHTLASRTKVAVAAFVAVVLFSASSAETPSPAETPPSRLDTKALWIAKSDHLVKVDPGGLGIELELATDPVHAVAVDPHRRHIWVHLGERLASYDFSGTPVDAFELPRADGGILPPFQRGHGPPGAHSQATRASALVIEPESGDLYLADGSRLQRFTTSGELRFQASFHGRILDLALDAQREVAWIVTRRGRLHAVDDGGDVNTLRSRRHRPIRAVTRDRASDAFWVATRRDLLRVTTDGEVELRVDAAHLRALDADGRGGVWGLGRSRLDLVHVTGAGEIDVERSPWKFSGLSGQIVHMAADVADGTVWVGDRFGFAHFGTDGELIAEQPNGIDSPSEDPPHGRGAGRPSGADKLRSMEHYADVLAPELEVIEPGSAWLAQRRPTIRFRHSVDADLATLDVAANGASVEIACDSPEDEAEAPRRESDCQPQRDLPEGRVDLSATVADFAGNPSDPEEHLLKIDTNPPAINVATPENGAITNVATQSITGTLSEPADLTLNGDPLSVTDGDHGYTRSVTLEEGTNQFVLRATDRAGNVTERALTVTLDTVPPPAVAASGIDMERDGDQVVLSGGPQSAEPHASVVVTNERSGETVSTRVAGDGSFRARIPAEAGDELSVAVEDAADNRSETTRVSADAGAGPLPPDPAEVAPKLPETGSPPFAETTAFLYSGADPIQTGVDPETIEARRAAVVRGRVATRDGEPLAGVTVTVLDHPEFGETRTRVDGGYDLAVNGGGSLTLVFEKAGRLSAQRTVEVPWRDFATVPKVALVELSDQSTRIDLADGEPMQAARGPVESDAAGERRATLMFPEGTTATITTPDGTEKQLSELTVRATEYTVGDNGPAAMPGELPPQSAYTYAVELSVDEARAQGVKVAGKDVVFNQKIPFYVDNFLDFPTGEPVPVGFYDNDAAAWEAVENGRIIEILSESDGQAVLDVTGDGEPATDAELDELGINDTELARLAELQEPGDSLWRTPVAHLSTWDCNWPFGPPDGAREPDTDVPESEADDPQDEDEEDCEEGCTISPQRQSVGESIDIAGTPFSLHYQSDRARGARDNSVEIPLTSSELPSGLQEVRLTVEVAGRQIERRFEPAPDMTHTFTWDGLDAYGRERSGSATAEIRLSYVYECVYVGAAGGNGFARFGDISRPLGTRSRCEGFVFPRRSTVTLESPTPPPGAAASNWSLSAEHFRSATSELLLRGDGADRTLVMGGIITTVAGNGTKGFSGDGGLATEAALRGPRDVTIGPDGSLYIADSGNSRIRAVSSEGIIETVAGNGSLWRDCYDDGVPATEVCLAGPVGLASGPEGSLFIVDRHSIRKIGPDGIIKTFAGGSGRGFSPDGQPAHHLHEPVDVAVKDGAVFVSEQSNNRIRRIGRDGNLDTIAGATDPEDLVGGFSGDGGPGDEAELYIPEGIAVGRDGSVYIADRRNQRIRKVTPDGTIDTIAGSGPAGFGEGGFSGDGGPAPEAQLDRPHDVALGPHGGVYVADTWNHRIRRIAPDGRIRTVAGTGNEGGSGDGGPAVDAKLSKPDTITFDDAGNLYIADTSNDRIRRVSAYALSRVKSSGRPVVPSADGNRRFVFDQAGRHLRTEDARTGAVLLNFERDGAGRLVAVTDGDGNTTIIERDTAGQATAIVAPDGQRTELDVNDQGHLVALTDPGGATTSMAYTDDGLLTRFEDPNGNINVFSYDDAGRLVKDAGPEGSGWSLERTGLADGFELEMTSGAGRVHTFARERDGLERIYTNTAPDGTVTRRVHTDSGTRIERPDGSVITRDKGPDPRFGMTAAVVERSVTTTPGGLERIVERSRSADVPEDAPVVEPETLTRTVSVNGRTATSVFDGGSRTFTVTSPAGREWTRTVDALGRPASTQVGTFAPTDATYDQRGRLAEITRSANGRTRRTQFAYHDSGAQAGYLASITDAGGHETRFAYDAAGRVTEQVQPDGRAIGFQYDANGNLTAITPPGRSAHVFRYDGLDERTDYEPPDLSGVETVTSYRYNADSQLTEILRPGGEQVSLDYDSGGRLVGGTAPVGSWQFGYAAATGQLTSIDAPGGVGLALTWDGPLPTSTTWSGPVAGTVERSFDDNFSIVEQRVKGTPIAFDYDADGLLTGAGVLTITRDSEAGLVTETVLASVTGSRGYNAFGELADRSIDQGGDVTYEVDYTRDELGRITSETETVGGETHTYGYDYDQAGRLVEVTRDGSVWHSYSYDANGNRLEHIGPGGSETGSYDAQDRAMQYAGADYSYTASGELASRTTAAGTTRADYDAFGNLRSVTFPDGRRVDYVIDGRHRRVGKKVDGTLVQGFLYRDRLNPVAELDGSGNIEARFVYGDKPNVPAYMIKDGTTYRIVSDHVGSVRQVINADTGEVAQRMDYSPFGRVIRDTNPGFQPFGFAGGLYDRDTGLVRFGARDYDPTLGRWTAKDPILFQGRGASLYAYVQNDPINYIDPTGLFLCSVLGNLGDFTIDLNAGIGFGLGLSGGLSFSSSGVTGSVTGGTGIGTGASAAVSGTANISDITRDRGVGTTFNVTGGGYFGGSASINAGTGGVTATGGFGIGFGLNITSGLRGFGQILECEEELDCGE